MNHLAQVDIGKNFLGSGTFLSDLGDIGKLTSNIVVAAISLSGIILLFLLIGGGIGIIAGSGSDNPEAVAKGKQAVTSALIGFIIVISAYWIVKLIEMIIGVSII